MIETIDKRNFTKFHFKPFRNSSLLINYKDHDVMKVQRNVHELDPYPYYSGRIQDPDPYYTQGGSRIRIHIILRADPGSGSASKWILSTVTKDKILPRRDPPQVSNPPSFCPGG